MATLAAWLTHSLATWPSFSAHGARTTVSHGFSMAIAKEAAITIQILPSPISSSRRVATLHIHHIQLATGLTAMLAQANQMTSAMDHAIAGGPGQNLATGMTHKLHADARPEHPIDNSPLVTQIQT